jgi:adhesin/invasin
MPSGVPTTEVTVAVSNGAVSSQFSMRASSPHISPLTEVDPGLFVNAGNRAAALNQDLTPATAATPIPAGSYVLLFFTGQGPISPPLADGTAAPATPLSLITGMVQVTIGGMPAQVSYAGVAPGFAGLSQVNAIIPAGLTPGDQPVFISINGVSSNAGLITVK